MKKIIMILLMLIMAVVSEGAVSGDKSEYVRKEVFDARMESFMKEMRGEFHVMNTKLEALSRRVDDNAQNLAARIDSSNHSLESRIDDLRNDIYLGLVILGILVGVPSVQKWYERLKASRPSVTIEDVKRLIEENNAELLKSLRP